MQLLKTLSNTCASQGFEIKKGGPAHRLVSTCDSRNAQTVFTSYILVSACDFHNAHAGDKLGSSEFWTVSTGYIQLNL